MKRMIALILALVMCLSLCACGGSGGGNADNETAQGNQPAVEPTAPAEDVTGVQLGEQIDLGFASMTFNAAALTYSVGGSGISTNAQDGMRLFSLTGTLKNTGGSPLSVGNIRAEMVFNGEYTYNASATILNSMRYPVSVAPLEEAEYWIYAEVPEALVEILSGCEVRFSLNEDFGTTPESVDSGDYSFRVQLGEAQCQAALSTAPTEFFEECPVLPTPVNYAPVYQSSSSRSSSNGQVTAIKYHFSVSAGRSDSIQDIYDAYIAALLDAGFSVGNLSECNDEIYANDIKLATISIDADRLHVNIVPGNEDLAAQPSDDGSVELPVASSDMIIQLGDTIVTDEYEFTLNNVELTFELKPANTSSWYSSYPAESGKVYIHIDGYYKNTSKQDVCIRDLFLPHADYDNGYKYDGFVVIDDGDTRFDWVSSYIAATPLETCHYHGLIECPEVVYDSEAPLYVTFTLANGVTYRYDIR